MTRRQVQTPGATPVPEKEEVQTTQPEAEKQTEAEQPPVPETELTVEQQLAAALERIKALEEPKNATVSAATFGDTSGQQAKARVAVLTEEGWSTKEAD